jgi:seryl-tRNA synthetase
MLPRNLIIEWRRSIQEALMVRYPPKSLYLSDAAEEMIHRLQQVEILGKQALDFQKEIEILRAKRNEISSRFPKASKEEKELLKQEVLACKTRISELEALHAKIESECQSHEANIPNVPDVGAPLWESISPDYEKYLRTNLQLVRNLIDEYNE